MTQFQPGIQNEVALERCFFGTEAVAGTAVAPTFKGYGELQVDKRRPLIDRPEYDGDFLPDRTPVTGPTVVEGSYAQLLAYEDLAIFPRYGMHAAPTPTSDGGSPIGYSWLYEPVASRLSLDTATVERGIPGLPFKTTMLHFPEFTISADVDDTEAAWKWASRVLARDDDLIAITTGTATGGSTSTVVKAAAGWTVNAFAGAFVTITSGPAAGDVREIASNDATTLTIVGVFSAAVANTNTFEISGGFTAGITDRTREIIEAPGTVLYLDTSSAIGTTLVTGRFISFSVTHALNTTAKRFLENVNLMSTRLGRGKTMVSGQIRLEFDSRREYSNWTAKTVEKIRIQQVGSTINADATLPKKTARIDIAAASWNQMTKDSRDNNRTGTWEFRGYQNTSTSKSLSILAKNTLAVLP